jgi:hypothetical protein
MARLGNFARGGYELKNPEKYIGTKTPTYRSSWEWHFMKMCDDHPAIAKWASESIKIPYRNPLDGKYTIYVPDFFIVYANSKGKTKAEVIEIKPENHTVKESVGKSVYNQAQYIKNKAKWEAAAKYCKQKGIQFRVVTEKDLFHTGKRR